ncbi:TonB-dependent receptor [Lewinella sp.]|uniref:TonB-dependent receptor n=1 Tax=Lewinella sp. TaxID=2004506 RepID=UPI003D6A6BB3
MKKSLIILLVFGCCVYSLKAQEVLNKRVNLQIKEQPFEVALYQLIDQEEIKLSFRNDILPEGLFSFDFQQQRLRIVLPTILEGTNLGYRLIGEQILLIPLAPSQVDTYYTISGYITDRETNEHLIGANVYDRYSQRGTVSNEYGFFSLQLPGGPAQLRLSYLGYESFEEPLNITNNTVLNKALQGSITLNEVVVYPRDTSANPIAGLATGQLIGLRETQMLPSLVGEQDVIRTAFLLPGVTTGADGAEGLQIRGGDAGQNLVLLDGVPVYYVNHAIGLFSIFNSDAVRSAQLLRAGFPARYGGRLSSVLDIRMKEGNQQALSGKASTGLLTSRFTLEGPIIKERSSFLLSGRWSFVHLLLKEQSRKFKESKGDDGATDYRFYDINAKYNHTFSDRNRVFLSLYRGRDNYDDLTTNSSVLSLTSQGGEPLNYDIDKSYGEGFSWTNTVGSFRWNHLFSDQLFANFSLTYSGLDQESFYNLEELSFEPSINQRDSLLIKGLFRSGIQDLGLKADWQLIVSPRQEFRFGIGANRRIFKPGALIVDLPVIREEPFANNTINTTELSTYLEGKGKFSSDWEWNAGAHLAWWYVRSRGHLSVQPRMSVNYFPDQRWTLSASLSRMVQNLHFLRNTTVNLPTEIWVPSTDKIRPSEAWMSNLGYQYKISPFWELQGDVYYKKMNRILSFLEGVEGFEDWEDNVVAGEGEAYGAEWQLRKVKGKLTGWVSYTLSKSERQFEELNLGRVYPFRYDRRHNFQLAAIYQISPACYFSANWGYASGFAITLPLVKFASIVPGEITPPYPIAIDPERKNNIRMPAYHRLDVNVHFEWNRQKRYRHELNLGIYNLYNRNNPLYYDVRRSLVNQQNTPSTQYDFVEVQLAPILPSISYKISF